MRSIAFLAVLMAFGPARADDTLACLNELTGPLVDVTGTENVNNDWFWFEDGARFDARGDTFLSQSLIPDETKSKYPIDLRALGDAACWAGGAAISTDAIDATWLDRKSVASAGFISQEVNVIIDGIRIHNAHDGIRPAWSKDGPATVSFTIRNSWVSYNRDDCIENDWHAGGLIDDSLFDGCYVFASATGGAEKSPNVVTIQNSLIYLQEQPGPNGWDDPTIMGHGELFKWSALAPDVIIRDTIFLIEDYTTTDWNSDGQPDHSANALAFKNIRECSNVTVVWDGPGDFPGRVPACVTVTKDRTVWDAARAKWIAEHPLVMRIAVVDEPVPEPTPEPIPEPEPELIDTAGPLIEWVSPAIDVHAPSWQIAKVIASDESGVARVEIYVNNVMVTACNTDECSANFHIRGKPDTYLLDAEATDIHGNISTAGITIVATK